LEAQERLAALSERDAHDHNRHPYVRPSKKQGTGDEFTVNTKAYNASDSSDLTSLTDSSDDDVPLIRRKNDGKRKLAIDLTASPPARKKSKRSHAISASSIAAKGWRKDDFSGLFSPVTPTTARAKRITSPGSPFEREPANASEKKFLVTLVAAHNSNIASSSSRTEYHVGVSSIGNSPGLIYTANEPSIVSRLAAVEKALRDIATPKDVLNNIDGRMGAISGEVTELDEIVQGLRSKCQRFREDIDTQIVRVDALEDLLAQQKMASEKEMSELKNKLEASERKAEECSDRLRAVEHQMLQQSGLNRLLYRP
jgi:hypothetical protein